MQILDIGEVVERSGVAPSALRYYEDIGLIESIGRHGLRRQYGPGTLTRLSLIALGKAAGFSLDEIAAMFGKDGRPDVPRAGLRAKAEALDQQIRNLSSLRDALRHAADCPAPSHMECPTFQRLLRVAGRRKPVRQKDRA